MRKLLMMVLTLTLFVGLFGGVTAQANTAEWLDKTQLDNGMITVAYPVKKNVKTKLMIAKGKENYTYNLVAAGEKFPLQLGNGKYQVSVLEQVTGTNYRRAASEEIVLNLKTDHVVYLNAVQNVMWNDKNAAIIKAKELTKNLKTNEEKVKAIYNFVYTTIDYDKKLAATVQADYIPNIDSTLKTRQAICYGYAALFAAMLRSQDIPTKLVMGETSYVDVYHAWNEVYLNGKWVVIDTTVDAGMKNGSKKIEMIKDANKYKAEKVY